MTSSESRALAVGEDNDTTRQFFARLWGADAEGALPGVHMIVEKTETDPKTQACRWIHHPVHDVRNALARASEISARGRDAYFACADYSSFNGSGRGNRTKANALGARCLWLDLDCGEGKAYPDKTAAFQALREFCESARLPKPSFFVDSGNGLHVYWQFGQLIEKEVWSGLAASLKNLADGKQLKADPSRTADIASVMRVPGTYNWKDPEQPRPVGILNTSAEHKLEAFASALGTAGGDHATVKNADNARRDTPPVETMRAMLEHLTARNHFEGRKTWIQAGMALKVAYGDEVGFNLWSLTHIDKTARADAPDQWASFASEEQPGYVTIATIIRAAKDAGFVDAVFTRSEVTTLAPIAATQFTGNGGDVRNGQIFAGMFRNQLLHVYETGDWLRFDPRQGWVCAPPGEADRAAKETVDAMRAIAADQYKVAPEDPKTKRLMAHVERSSRTQSLRAMIEMAKSEPGMTVQLSDFDSDPMLLGLANGVLNLNNWTMVPATPDVLVSKRCNVAYDPNAECVRFQQFLAEVQPEKEMREFLARMMGYCLTGAVDEQVFAFIYGLGANGKSVFIELMAWILGDYAHKISTEMLMHHQRNPQGPSPDIVSLRGRRFVYANETEEGGRLAEARIKDMTGGDTLTGRVPYGKADITFRPTHKLFIVGNHKPEITDNSFGMWRRVALTPFEQTIPEASRDPRLLEVLKGEASGVLNWMIAGLRDYRKDGLQIPQKIKAATATYREEQDVIGEWIADRCVTGAGYSEKKGFLYGSYQDWAKLNGHRPLAQGRLTRRLNERGYRLSQDRRTIVGLSLAGGTALGGGPTP